MFKKYNTIDELLKAMDELKSMEGCEIDLIKRGVDQLELILNVKETQLSDAFLEIENYKKKIAVLERRLRNAEDQVKNMIKDKKNEGKSKRAEQDLFDLFMTHS